MPGLGAVREGTVSGAWPFRGHPVNPQLLPLGLPRSQSPRDPAAAVPALGAAGGIGLRKNRVPVWSLCVLGAFLQRCRAL